MCKSKAEFILLEKQDKSQDKLCILAWQTLFPANKNMCSISVMKSLFLNVLWMFKMFVYIFCIGYANSKETFHLIVLQTLWECYFWMFCKHSKISCNIKKL